jgi:hypothetical protein
MLFILFMYATWDMYLNMDEIGYKQQCQINLSFAIFYMSFLLHFEFAICDILSWFLIEIILALN